MTEPKPHPDNKEKAMTRDYYKPLAASRLETTDCHVADTHNPGRVSLDSPAIEVMTDLRRIPAATIEPDASINETNQRMIARGVRLLFVTDDDGRILGLVTATDILGERPVQRAHEREIRVAELSVRDIMTPIELVDVVSMQDVRRAEVGHVIATLKDHGRQHALVLERDDLGKTIVRGIFSSSQIARQMGTQIQTPEIARSFFEIESAIAH